MKALYTLRVLGMAVFHSARLMSVRALKSLALLPLVLVMAIFSWVMLVLFLVCDLVALPFVGLARLFVKAPKVTERKREASIITVSIDGRELLERLLPSLDRAIAFDGGDHEIIVVDNGSQDDTVEWLQKNWPQVKIVALPTNHFFGGGNREGMKAATKDYVIFLNNDMVVEEDFLPPLLDGFVSDDIFAVSSEIFFTDESKRREETGKTRGGWKRGELILSHDLPTDVDKERVRVPAFWAGGGSAAFDRRLFCHMGMFESLFDPFYMEDTGVSYQAWKRGYRVLFAPKSRVAHEHRTTGRRLFGERYIDATTRRNYYLFIWRNITDLPKTLEHFLYFPQKFVKAARRKDFSFEFYALGRALLKLPQALWLRETTRHWYRRGDSDVMRLSNSYAEYDAAFDSTPKTKSDRLRLLLLLARLPKRNTDGSWILFNLIRRLGERHEVSLLTFLDAEWEREHVEDLRPFCHEIDAVVRAQNPGARNLHGLVPGRLTLDYTDPVMVGKIHDAIHSGRYDIFQCEYFEMAHMVPDLCRIPSIFTHHEVMTLTCRRAAKQEKGFLQRLRCHYEGLQYLWYELDVCRKFRRVVTLSQFDEDFLSSYDRNLPIETIPSGIDLDNYEDYRESRRHEGPVVIFVGYYLHPPNIDAATFLARDIFPAVRQAVPNAECLLVGRNPPDSLQALEKSVPGVTVTGFVEDLRPYVDRASVFAIPIRKGAGLRGKFLEAWAMGKAVVSTSVAAQGFRGEPGEHLLVGDRADELAEHIISLMTDEQRRHRLGDAGRRLVEDHYSDRAMARRYEEMYRELLESPS